MKMTKKKLIYPSKTSLNLAIRERTINSPSRIIPLTLLVALLIFAFAKFAVIDRLLQVSAAQSEVDGLRSQLDTLNEANAGYEDLLTEYARNSSGWMSAEEVALVDRNTVFDLLQTAVLPSANLRDMSVNLNVLSLNLTGLSLRDASTIVNRLKARDDVIDVMVFTAGSKAEGALDQTRKGSVSMTIALTNGYPMPSESEEGGGN
ncbi:hypothetical protein RWV98_17905 [Agathobaculum sp. NTUH-O15-33]|uniref:hypothetical protein n=1 Tax=Agathobaculum sp. NTUH-O15-33 TaxID=3079302 RepID=UPI0029585DD6|nr:hypothetical protein [Agathobaculum sp. NTUH-O15-33]WNX84422.1 hypothetical protein RWV98_17905 [Agathobaculum sp. NTUH-O15-33]